MEIPQKAIDIIAARIKYRIDLARVTGPEIDAPRQRTRLHELIHTATAIARGISEHYSSFDQLAFYDACGLRKDEY